MKAPAVIYINWASYDELSDRVELTEKLAMEQFEHLLRLRDRGCRFDAYVMDCFWYARGGGYRAWRKPHWPKGPDRWLAACARHGVAPGLWIGSNCVGAFMGLEPIPAWEGSLNASRTACSYFEGGFRAHLLETLEEQYAQGVRLWKWDFTQMDAVTPAGERELLPSEVRERNREAFCGLLEGFRERHPDICHLGYNGLEESFGPVAPQSSTAHPLRRVMHPRLVEAFDAVYCGDPRPADVPCADFWRSKDVYSDHMVRYYAGGGVPLNRIDNSGFMVGTTGTCYFRGKAGWRAMLLLSLMRGGWANTVYGNLDLLDEVDGAWFAKAQALVLPLQEAGRWSLFGGTPGRGEPYGFTAAGADGALWAVVNPGQATARVAVPGMRSGARVLFSDDGPAAAVESGGVVVLAPEQMALVAGGELAVAANDLGRGDGPRVPAASRAIPVQPVSEAKDRVKAWVPTGALPRAGRLRLVFRQYGAHGFPLRTTGGAAPNGELLGERFRITVEQASEVVRTSCSCNKKVWSGLSWWVEEVDLSTVRPLVPLLVQARTEAPSEKVTLEVYLVE